MDRLTWGVRDRQLRETIFQALTAAKLASLAAAREVVAPLPGAAPGHCRRNTSRPAARVAGRDVAGGTVARAAARRGVARQSEWRAQKRFRQLLKAPHPPAKAEIRRRTLG
jgi:hypothetical protein